MDIWDILEIEYTTDEKEIRDAYAECAKKVHPEEHPEEFKRLQAAYKQAIKHAKSVGKLPTEGIEIIETEDDFFYFVEFDEYFKETNDTGFEEVSEEVPDVYDYSVIPAGEEPYDDIRKEFFWRFKQLYDFSYTRNNVKAWKILMEDPDYKPLFEFSDFLSDLSAVIGAMQHINRNVWKYMVKRFEAYAHVIKCDVYIDHIKERMARNSVKYFGDPLNDLSDLSRDEQIIVEEIMSMGKKEGKTKLKIFRMDYFVPHLFYVLHRKEKRVNTQTAQPMSDELLFRHEIRPSLFAKILLVVYIIVMIYGVVMLITGNDGKNTNPQMNHEQYQESIIESIREDLRNNYQDNSIFESIGESLRDKQNR